MNFHEKAIFESYDTLNDIALELYGKEYWLAHRDEQEVIDTLAWSRSV